MKNIILTLLIGIMYTYSFAQPKQGNYVIGGSTSFDFDNSSITGVDNFSTSAHLIPQFGKFLSEKILLEGGIGYSWIYNRTNNNSILAKIHTHGILGNISINRFFALTDKLNFTLGGYLSSSIGFANSTWESSGNITTSSSNRLMAGIGATPGLAYFINDKWMVNAKVGSLGYSMTHFGGNYFHHIGYNFTSDLFSLGIRYIVDRSSK